MSVTNRDIIQLGIKRRHPVSLIREIRERDREREREREYVCVCA